MPTLSESNYCSQCTHACWRRTRPKPTSSQQSGEQQLATPKGRPSWHYKRRAFSPPKMNSLSGGRPWRIAKYGAGWWREEPNARYTSYGDFRRADTQYARRTGSSVGSQPTETERVGSWERRHTSGLTIDCAGRSGRRSGVVTTHAWSRKLWSTLQPTGRCR